jgi:hypothetical protein
MLTTESKYEVLRTALKQYGIYISIDLMKSITNNSIQGFISFFVTVKQNGYHLHLEQINIEDKKIYFAISPNTLFTNSNITNLIDIINKIRQEL